MKFKILSRFPVLLVLAVMSSGLARVKADTPALSFTSGIGSGNQQPHNLVLGWSFNVSAPILVTQLGLWDGPGGYPGSPNTIGDGFGISHNVTLWTSGGTSLTTLNIPSGTIAPITDGFRYVSLAIPLTLVPGDYVITAYYPQANFDLDFANAGTITTASGVSYGIAGDLSGNPAASAPFHGSRQQFDTTGTGFPTGDLSSAPKSYFGPNFQFVAVPEPAISTLLVLSLPIALVRWRNRRR